MCGGGVPSLCVRGSWGAGEEEGRQVGAEIPTTEGGVRAGDPSAWSPRGSSPPGLRSHSPGRPPKCRGTGALSEARSVGARVWLLWESTSSRRAVLLLVTVGHRLLVAGLGGPLGSRRARGPTGGRGAVWLASAASSSRVPPRLCSAEAGLRGVRSIWSWDRGPSSPASWCHCPSHSSLESVTDVENLPAPSSAHSRTWVGAGHQEGPAHPNSALWPWTPHPDLPASPAPAALGRGAPGTGPGGR